MLFDLYSTWSPRFPFITTGESISFNADLAGDGFGETVGRILSLFGWIAIIVCDFDCRFSIAVAH